MPNAAEHIKRKLPSMYHQFKQLADIDITTTPMEVGPTTHYIMGGVRVHPETQMSTVPGLFAAGECGAGLHGANRLGGNSLSDLLVFGRRAGQFAVEFAKQHGFGRINIDQVDSTARWALQPFERRASSNSAGEGPYRVQHDLQQKMQDLVGIVRTEQEMLRAVDEIVSLKERARQVVVDGNREYNTGWHTALDLANLLTVSEAITRAAIERKESRGGHFREDYPAKTKTFGELSIVARRGSSGEMQILREKIPEMPAELKQVIEEQK
jgi:succinate dehydrogenase / fumarate reductase flavoprotein subunit